MIMNQWSAEWMKHYVCCSGELVIDLYELCLTVYLIFFFFNDTATTEIYTLSLHDALPIYARYGPHPH